MGETLVCDAPAEISRELFALPPVDVEHLKKPASVKVVLSPPTTSRPNGYIGATADFPHRPGEGWRRGCDLPDGPFTEKTVDEICAAIKNQMIRLMDNPTA